MSKASGERLIARALLIRFFKEPTKHRAVIKCALVRSKKAAQIGESNLTFPGGGVEKGETLEEALFRALIEEVGYPPDVTPQFLPINKPGGFVYIPNHGPVQRCHYFIVLAPNDFVPMPGTSVAEVAWYCPQELAQIASQQLSPSKRHLLSSMLTLAQMQYREVFSGARPQLRLLAQHLLVPEGDTIRV